MTNEAAAARIRIKGRVQGVGYRFFAERAAIELGLKGWVRNRPDGDVECEVEGTPAAIERFSEALRKGPSMSRVESVEVSRHPAGEAFSGFEIRG